MKTLFSGCELGRLLVCVACCFGQSRALVAQVCEQPIDARLRHALAVGPHDTVYATRDYHPTLFPGVTFYRASLPTGFHMRPRQAAVVVSQSDTILIQNLADLSAVWAKVTKQSRGAPDHLGMLLGELLFQTGFLQRGDRILDAAADISELVRRSLDPKADLSQVKPMEVQTKGNHTEIVAFLQTADGVVRVRAQTDAKGGGTITEDLIARPR